MMMKIPVYVLVLILGIVKNSYGWFSSLPSLHKSIIVIPLSLSFELYQPSLIFADEETVVKMEYFKPEDTSKIGDALFNENDLLKEKLVKIKGNWNIMIEKLEVALKEGKKDDAQIILSNGMSSLKTDMRTISKIKTGGDIVKRNNGIDGFNAGFDFNSGKFDLKLIPGKAEVSMISND